jgi:hypothetical protein
MNALTDLSPYSLVVLLITLTLAVLHQIQATGKLLGQWNVPPTVVAYALFVGPFVAGIGASLGDAKEFSTLSALNALIAGVRAVVIGAAPGVAVSLGMQAHVTVPQKMMAMRAANTNAVAAAAKVAVVLLMLVGLGRALTACNQTPVQVASDVSIGLQGVDCILTTGSADLGKGDSMPATIADVVVQCAKYGITEAQATGVLASHRAAEIREGFAPKS